MPETPREIYPDAATRALDALRNGETNIVVRIIGFLGTLLLVNPMTALALLLIGLIYASVIQSGREAAAERRAIMTEMRQGVTDLDSRRAMADERNAVVVASAMKELARSVEKSSEASQKVIEAVSGKRFIPPTTPTKKVEPKADEKKGP